ncbi:MAG: PilZ domain-containing protein [Desulfobacterales bacterium]|nr:PilZ domain-containing protein [Desulfobacterales bacterium]
MEEKERREESRYKIDTAAEVRYGTSTINAKAVEISTHGLRIESNNPINPGTKVEAVLFLTKPERISGEVKWVLAEAGEGMINYKIGISCESRNLITDNGS